VTDAIVIALNNVKKLRGGLPYDIKTQRAWQTRFDSSIILLSIASVAGALYRASIPAIGGIALGAEGLSQYRAYYNPQALGSGYIAAERATRCVYSTGEPLLNQSPKLLWQQIFNLRLAIADVEASMPSVDTRTTAGQAVSDSASQALTAAKNALNALTAEAGAYNGAAGQIDAAHDAIKNYKDKIEHRTASPSFNDVSSQLNAAITAQATSAGQTAAARAQLLSAYQAQAKAQAAAPGTPNLPAPTAGEATSLSQATNAQPTSAPPTAAAMAHGAASLTPGEAAVEAAVGPAQTAAANAGEVSALIKATEIALGAMPAPQYTATLTAVSQCVAGLN
jgi:hypothetical protein